MALALFAKRLSGFSHLAADLFLLLGPLGVFSGLLSRLLADYTHSLAGLVYGLDVRLRFAKRGLVGNEVHRPVLAHVNAGAVRLEALRVLRVPTAPVRRLAVLR